MSHVYSTSITHENVKISYQNQFTINIIRFGI